MRRIRFLIAASLLCIASFGLEAQTRGIEIAAQSQLGSNVAVGKQWAVFIAIDRYREWGPLSNPVRDAQEIRDILLENYYIDEVIEIYNQDATAENIRRCLIDLRTRTDKNDSVFIFYAGHGYTDETNTGFWIPVDAGRNILAQSNWLPNIQIRNMISALPAVHVFLIADACFSGDILNMSRGAPAQIDNEYFRRAYSRVSRQVMTSGASESVPDASEFAMRLKSILFRSTEPYLDPDIIFTAVRTITTTQPLLGAIKDSEHQDGGSFLFFRRIDEEEIQRLQEEQALAGAQTQASGTTQATVRPVPPAQDRPQSRVAAARASEDAWKHRWLYLAPRVGGGGGFYSSTTYNNIDNGAAMDFGVQAMVQITQLFAVQTELLFSADWVSASVSNARYADDYNWVSLQIPILAKLTFRPSRFLLGLFGGVGFNIPVSTMVVISSSSSFLHREIGYLLPITGIVGGMAGIKLGPGALFLDGRVNIAFADTDLGSYGSFYRTGMTFSMGYEFSLLDKNR